MRKQDPRQGRKERDEVTQKSRKSREVSVIITNYNTRELLKGCLTSILSNQGDVQLEVLVADNGSTDGSAQMVRQHFPSVYLASYAKNMGFTRAINPLLSMATGTLCLILHPDVELLPETLQHFLAFLDTHPKAGVVGGNLYYPDGSPNPCEILFPGFRNDLKCFLRKVSLHLPSFTGLPPESNPLEWCHEKTCQVNWVWNACMMVRREVFDKIGLFDENFFVWFADWDFCKRATDAGWAVYYLDSAKAVHHERQSFLADREDMLELRYKVDGWYSVAGQIRDRCRFLNKHVTAASRFGTKAIAFTENTLKLCAIVARLSLGRTGRPGDIFQLKACLEVLRAILGA